MTQTVLLGDICDVRDGTHDSPKPKDSGHPLVTSKHIKNHKIDFSTANLISDEDFEAVNKRSKVDQHDILISMIGTVGELALIDYEPTFAIKNIGLIKTGDELLGKYLFYYLQSTKAKQYIEASLAGSTQKFIGLGQLRNFPVELPDIETQKRIADILGTIDEKIELNRQMNETLEQMGRALFRHYFIDNPEAEKWEEKSLDKIADFLNGLAMQKYPKVNGGPALPVIKIREMSSGITSNTDIASANIPEKYVVHNGDLLFSWSGTLLVKFWSEGQGALNQHLFKVTSDDYPEWLYYYWTKYHLDDFIQTAQSKATTMGHIQRKHLTQAKVLVPDSVTMRKIGEQIQPLIDESKENAQQIQNLTTIRNTLLPRLIDGKVAIL